MTAGPAASSPPRRLPDTTHDAVVIIPGILGSELIDTETDTVLWGLDLPSFLKAWGTGSNLRTLHLSDQERDGIYGRIKVGGLLKFPAWLSFLRGIEPYTTLVDEARKSVAHPDAVLEFAYDWRLPVSHNGAELARAAIRHLEKWRQHPAYDQARLADLTGREAKLVLVAHSMGGLLVQHAGPDLAGQVRAVVTLGTPFHGAVKAAHMITTGGGVPMPARKPLMSLLRSDADDGARALARTLPGIYDLLPSYRCVKDGAHARMLTVGDVVAIGGDQALAEAAFTARASRAQSPLTGHELVVGKAQPTWQSLSIVDGTILGLEYELRVTADGIDEIDRLGDGTVPTGSAELPGVRPCRLAQQHGALARASDAISFAVDVIKEVESDLLGPPLSGESGLGLLLPDVAVAIGEQWPAVITGITHPRQARCIVADAATGRQVAAPRIEHRDHMQALIILDTPGLYRVTLAGSGESPTSQLILAQPR